MVNMKILFKTSGLTLFSIAVGPKRMRVKEIHRTICSMQYDPATGLSFAVSNEH